MKSQRWTPISLAALLFAALVIGLVSSSSARAQGPAFPDVPANHWAYQAVQDLADKGYVKGYPDGKFLGERALTRYEFATVIDRMVQTLDDLSQKVGTLTTPTGAPVTQDDLNKIQSLVDSFQAQLQAIQSTAATQQAQFQAEMDSLRSEVSAAKKEADQALATANNSYGAGPGRKYTIGGYIQMRYLSVGSSNSKVYPQGAPASSSPYNGTYAQNGNDQGFVLRRARIRLSGQITDRTDYAIQIDTSGLAANKPSTSSNSSNAAVSVDEGWASYTLGNGSKSKYPTFEAGQFGTPFGYELALSSAYTLTPESPLAFSEGSAGLFANQKYDKGVQLYYNPSIFRVTFAAINGDGTLGDEESHGLDTIYRAGAHTKDNVASADFSYYHGHIPYTAETGASYEFLKKDLWDVDAQLTARHGPFLLGEYVAGRYDARDYFGAASAQSPTGPLDFASLVPAPGNHVQGYYIQGGWTFDKTAAHPLTLFASWDVLDRSESGMGATAAGGASGSWFDDENLGYGVTYNLDKAFRVRLYYIQPQEVAHAEGTPQPLRAGLTTAEVQVSY